ncbi:MAG: MBL fold metallo-hydrolase [Rhodospirillaceae bacterium]
MRVTILGCGGSSGVPLIGNRWGACDATNPKNRRRRASILVEHADTIILIDTAPDLREQLIDALVTRIDAVLYTHDHADHCHGLDDLREINRMMLGPVPVYGLAETMDLLRQRFPYCFDPIKSGDYHYRPDLRAYTITGIDPFQIGSLKVIPFLQDHGFSRTLGYRFGNFAYSTDVLRLDEAAFTALDGITTWVVDCVREEPHPVHSHLDNTLDWVKRVTPLRTWLTHMSNSLDYETMRRQLPMGIEPAYDGLEIFIED